MKLKEGQQAFIELTNPIHGGEGWEFGEALWSPTKARNTGADSWAVMREVRPGDLIIHSLKKGSQNHTFYGISIAKSSCITLDEEPLIPGDWSKDRGYEQYYKIPLKDYCPFKVKPKVSKFLEEYREQLKGFNNSFFNRDITHPAQKYLVKLEEPIFEMIIEFLLKLGNEILKEVSVQDVVGDNEAAIPGRVTVTTERKIRDSALVKAMKEEFNNKCQICGKSIALSNGKLYSEGHHLKPLGSHHEGPDTRENIIILCPNHHVEFDYGSIAIDPNTNLIIHIDHNNEFHGKNLSYTRKDINKEFIKYHHKNIFNK